MKPLKSVKLGKAFFLFTINIVCSEYKRHCTKYYKCLHLPSMQKIYGKKSKKKEHKKNPKNNNSNVIYCVTYNKSVIQFQT